MTPAEVVRVLRLQAQRAAMAEQHRAEAERLLLDARRPENTLAERLALLAEGEQHRVTWAALLRCNSTVAKRMEQGMDA